MSKPSSETLTNRTVAGISWSMVATVGRQFLTFGSLAVLARLLGPEAYGLMAMAAVITNLLVNFRDLGTSAAVVQRQDINPSLLSTLFWFNLVVGTTLTLIVLAIAGPAAHFYHDDRVASILMWLSVTFVLVSAGIIQQSLLSREMSFKQLAIADFGSALAGYLVAIPCALAGLGVKSLIYANVANALVSTALLWYLCPWKPSLMFDMGQLRSISRFSLNLSGFGMINYASRNADNLIIGRVLGSVLLGYYQMAYNLMLYPLQNISSVISQVLLPAFSKIQNDNERFRGAYVRSCLLIALATFPLMAGMGVVADPFLRALFGPKWVPAIVTFQILAPVGLVQSVYTTIGQIYIVKGRTDWFFYWGIYTAIVLVSSFLIGIQFGITGVATAYAVAYYVLILYPGFAIPFRLIGLRFGDFFKLFIPQLAATGIMVLACLGWLWMLKAVAVNNDWVRLLSTSLLGTCVYLFAILWMRAPGLLYLEEILQGSSSPLASRMLAVTGIFAGGPEV